MRNLSKFSPNNYSAENPVIFEKAEGDSSRVVAGENTHRQANKISEMILQNNNTDSRGKILIQGGTGSVVTQSASGSLNPHNHILNQKIGEAGTSLLSQGA